MAQARTGRWPAMIALAIVLATAACTLLVPVDGLSDGASAPADGAALDGARPDAQQPSNGDGGSVDAPPSDAGADAPLPSATADGARSRHQTRRSATTSISPASSASRAPRRSEARRSS